MHLRTTQRWKISVVTLAAFVALLAACGHPETTAPGGVVAGHEGTRRPPRPVDDGQVLTGEDSMRTTTSEPAESTTTSIITESAFSKMETTTTSTTTPPDPTEVRHGEDACSGPQTLRVRVDGSDGLPVTAQISADFKKNGQKVNANSEPIPNDQYSQTTYINTSEGTDEVCFPAVPNAEVYLEVYPKDFVNGEYTHRSNKYGSVMWHGVWPGPGQGVFLRVPLACAPGQSKGKTGTINVTTTVDDQEVSMPRLVAWSRTEGSMKVTPGFAVADSEHYGTPEVKRIETVAADQAYFVQVQTADDKVITIEPVPVEACKDTNIEVKATSTGCWAKVNDGDAKDCRVLKKPVG